ncbi:MAG: hypothetical protein AUG89_08060 [Acidobacteria bacterium 13_1_20CM_4_56_7]|nr:MAG: hypothetical protein AUG89_08060 [Acidobacteria bacterium 13_1_20CM_4_56_7]
MQLAPEVFVVEPTLMVIGLDHRTAPLAMRERFFIAESRRYEVLRHLSSAEGIEEVAVLSIPCRTEFLIWASEPTLAANSLLHFLGTEHGLKLTEWEHFFRLLDDAALTHVFRVAAGLDSLVVGERAIVSQVRDAWEKARTVGACGPFLNAVLGKAVELAEVVHSQTGLGKDAVSFASAAVQSAQQVFGSLEGRRLLLLGTSKTAEASARLMMGDGASPVVVIDQSPQRARELAESLGASAATLAERWQSMLQADIVISATGCPHVVLTREEAEQHRRRRCSCRGKSGENDGSRSPRLRQEIAGARWGTDHRGASPQPGRVMPARTGFLYRGAGAVYPGAGSIATRNHSTGHTEDCQLPRPRTQGTSREGGTGAHECSGDALVPPGFAQHGACRHHFGEKEAGARW